MKPKLIHAILIRAGDPTGYYLMTDSDGNVTSFASSVKAVRHFEGGYKRKHAQGYEGSMSACINSLFFQPAAISGSLADLGKLVVRSEDGRMSLSRLSHVSGTMYGIPCKPDEAATLWEAGDKPALI